MCGAGIGRVRRSWSGTAGKGVVAGFSLSILDNLLFVPMNDGVKKAAANWVPRWLWPTPATMRVSRPARCAHSPSSTWERSWSTLSTPGRRSKRRTSRRLARAAGVGGPVGLRRPGRIGGGVRRGAGRSAGGHRARPRCQRRRRDGRSKCISDPDSGTGFEQAVKAADARRSSRWWTCREGGDEGQRHRVPEIARRSGRPGGVQVPDLLHR